MKIIYLSELDPLRVIFPRRGVCIVQRQAVRIVGFVVHNRRVNRYGKSPGSVVDPIFLCDNGQFIGSVPVFGEFITDGFAVTAVLIGHIRRGNNKDDFIAVAGDDFPRFP